MKASGSYASLIQGVSQQIPEVRMPGQHGEQVNMLPDVVKGLARRPGSEWMGERNTALASSLAGSVEADTDAWGSFDYTSGGVDYTILFRRGARVEASLPCMIVYNRSANTFLPYTRGADANLDTVEAGGISSITSIGRFVYFSGNTLVPSLTTVSGWADAGNQGRAILWVKSGTYNRKYSATVTKTDDTSVTFSYTTPSSAYTELLDTSGIPVFIADPAGGTTSETEAAHIVAEGAGARAELQWYAWSPTSLSVSNGGTAMVNVYPAAPAAGEFSWGGTGAALRYCAFHTSLIDAPAVSMTYTHTKTITNPSYARQINNATNAYNQALNAYVKQAALDIEPENIALKLRDAAIAAGVGGTTTADGPNVAFTNVKGMQIEDGGDNTLMVGVASEVTSVEKVSVKHWVGKVVRVRARNAESSYYVKAVARDTSVTSGITEVTWVEGAGVTQTLTSGVCMATVEGGELKVASSAAGLTALAGVPVPDYSPSTAGDDISNPPPFFVGRKITYLGVFQDRLLLGSGGVIRASRTGDYLNFFRTTILTYPADEAIEFLSESSESDELRHSVLYDKSLVLFGRRRQYVVDGRVTLTPTSANLPAMSTHADASDTSPVSAGGLIFYAKNGVQYASVHQIQPGQNPESPESYPASQQVDAYFAGKVIDLKSVSKPATIFMRTQDARSSLFVFTYTDQQDGRKQSAWHRWDFHPDLGPIIGMSAVSAGLLVYFMRPVGSVLYTVCDLLPLDATLSTHPYLDSQRTLAAVEGGGGSVGVATTGDWKVSVSADTGNQYRFLGETLANRAAFKTTYPTAVADMRVGILYDSYVTLTNPFMRDRNDVTITTGQLVVTKLIATMQDSSGYVATVEAPDDTWTYEHNGRITDDPNNVVGREVITDFTSTLGIGREVRKYDCTIHARTWLPLTITRLEWVGQFFNRTQRAS